MIPIFRRSFSMAENRVVLIGNPIDMRSIGKVLPQQRKRRRERENAPAKRENQRIRGIPTFRSKCPKVRLSRTKFLSD